MVVVDSGGAISGATLGGGALLDVKDGGNAAGGMISFNGVG